MLITRHDQAVTSVNVDPPSLSDHSMIVANVSLHAPPAFTVTRLPRRSWGSLDVDKFAEDLRHSTLMQAPPSDVDELFQCYNETLRSLVDVHAPLRMVSCRRGLRSARWYDGECRKEKAKTRRLERVYVRRLRHGHLASTVQPTSTTSATQSITVLVHSHLIVQWSLKVSLDQD